jgi:2-oxoglutarate dehydrogenase E2 component (dihydrolipoamide succinyltransferase)
LQIDVAVNAPEAGTIKEFLVNEEDTVTVGQDLLKMELGGAPSGPKEEQAKEEPKAPASDKQETSSQPDGGKEKEAPKEQKTPEPKKEEPKKADKPAPAPKKDDKKAEPKDSKPKEESAYGSREERRVRLKNGPQTQTSQN